MADESDVAPALADIVGESDNAVRDGIYGISEVGITAAAPVPILAEVLRGAQAQSTGFVVAGGIGFSDGKIETIGEVYLYSCACWNGENQNAKRCEGRGERLGNLFYIVFLH